MGEGVGDMGGLWLWLRFRSTLGRFAGEVQTVAGACPEDALKEVGVPLQCLF
jgi:hypothetical protein